MKETIEKIEEIKEEPEVQNDPTVNDWKSNNIDRLATSLAKAQSEMKGAKASSTNPFFKSNYADLHTVIESSLPYLNKHGLSVVQGHYRDEIGTFYVTTTLLHASGQWVRSKLQMPVGGKKDAQAIGATTTYARRFSLCAMVGIAQTDDDGESLK
tara:strand:- start:276 stop:740 length:465 start_codon:yes stop_codon:yes gene_type:complete